jgi:hypothetical protein
MTTRPLYLLSPYRMPTHHSVMLNEDEMNAWMNGYALLWHPALIFPNDSLPKVDSSYEHDQPHPQTIYAVPNSPTMYQPDDWEWRVRQNGGLQFQCTADREETLRNLQSSIRKATGEEGDFASEGFVWSDAQKRLIDLPMESIRPFLALGLGYLWIDTLFEAMDHDKLLMVEEFRTDFQTAIQAILDGNDPLESLKQAAAKLQSAREVLYPSAVHVLDFVRWKEILDFPASKSANLPSVILASASQIEQLQEVHPDQFQELKKGLFEKEPPVIELIGGLAIERDDAFRPVESQVWNLREGKRRIRELLGYEVAVHARTIGGFQPQSPAWLNSVDIRHAMMVAFDSSLNPTHRATIVSLPSPDGKTIDAFCRVPNPASDVQTFFNLAITLKESIQNDSSPTIALIHFDKPSCESYRDLVELGKLANVLGEFTTLSRYFSDVMAGEYAPAGQSDEFFSNSLEDSNQQHLQDGISRYPALLEGRRRIDHIFGLASLYRSLHLDAPTDVEKEKFRLLQQFESTWERTGQAASELIDLEQFWATTLTDRLQRKSEENQPGRMLLNTSHFPRRAIVSIPDATHPLPVDGAIKAIQWEGSERAVIVEIPAFGYAWIPADGIPGTSVPKARLRMQDGTTIRNEYLEVEIDSQSGGIKSIRDVKTGQARLGMQVVYNPGSQAKGQTITVVSAGPTLAHLQSVGEIIGDGSDCIAKFKVNYRLWIGRPVLEVAVEIEPVHAPVGYPWYAFFGCRFAWRDERSAILRGVNGYPSWSSASKPQTSEFLEVRLGKQSTTLYPLGLPFFQMQGSRMVDLIMITEHEKSRRFKFAIALDRELPMQTAFGLSAPLTVVPTVKGPPLAGPTGWLMHMDAAQMLLTGMRPKEVAGGPNRSIEMHWLETTNLSGSGTFRSVRDPIRAMQLESEDQAGMEFPIEGDAFSIDFTAGDWQRIQIDFD